MDFYSIWPVLALMAVAIAVVSTRLFSALDKAPAEHVRAPDTLDGLRAFLAFAVFFHHMSIRRGAVATGFVALPPVQFHALLGSFGVSLFFMITGYLFWGKLLRSGGCMDWRSLYVGRFFRIVPLYWALMAIYIAAVVYRAHFILPMPFGQFIVQCERWLAFGLWPTPEPLLGQGQSMPLVGMTWTLFYEWLFYLSLPALALLARVRFSLAAVAAALCVSLSFGLGLSGLYQQFVCLFLAGMLTASLLHSFPTIRGDSAVRSLVACALVIATFWLYASAYNSGAIILLCAFFALVASGTSLFGLLYVAGARRLGNASYSVYLLHGVVLSLFLAPSGLGAYAITSPAHFWGVAVLMAATLVCVASASFLLVERTGIAWGKRITDRLSEPRTAEGSAAQSR